MGGGFLKSGYLKPRICCKAALALKVYSNNILCQSNKLIIIQIFNSMHYSLICSAGFIVSHAAFCYFLTQNPYNIVLRHFQSDCNLHASRLHNYPYILMYIHQEEGSILLRVFDNFRVLLCLSMFPKPKNFLRPIVLL